MKILPANGNFKWNRSHSNHVKLIFNLSGLDSRNYNCVKCNAL